MKQIAIIGAGISGLRAALELTRSHHVTIFEKSSGVGGRVATRRLASSFINHGAEKFDGQDKLKNDPMAAKYSRFFSFDAGATGLPKAMRDELSESGAKFRLNAKVTAIEGLSIILEDGERHSFDGIILTAPVPQVREILGENIFPEVRYAKTILFIGERNDKPFLWEVPREKTEDIFDLSEEFIRAKFTEDLGGLTLKKWRYSRVERGVPELYVNYRPGIIIAGDAFDPEENHHIGASWLSGLAAGKALL